MLLINQLFLLDLFISHSCIFFKVYSSMDFPVYLFVYLFCFCFVAVSDCKMISSFIDQINNSFKNELIF